MSSGWIKFEKSLRDDPRVLRIARQLGNAGVTHERFTNQAHVTLVLGCLAQLWCYADTHVREGDTLDLGIDDIDEIVGLQGFCSMLPDDWLQVIDAEHVKLPGFLGHNGTEAKKKALTQKRVARHRESVTSERISKKRSRNADALPDQTRPDQDQTRPTQRVPSEPVEPERSTLTAKPPDPKVLEVTEAVGRVFEHWRTVHRHPHSQLDEKRRRTIRKALEHYPEADLCQSISGYRNSPHHMGQNDRATVYDDLELLLRDSKHIDAGLKLYAEPPRTDLSAKTRANVAAISDWKPPELRNAGQ